MMMPDADSSVANIRDLKNDAKGWLVSGTEVNAESDWHNWLFIYNHHKKIKLYFHVVVEDAHQTETQIFAAVHAFPV